MSSVVSGVACCRTNLRVILRLKRSERGFRLAVDCGTDVIEGGESCKEMDEKVCGVGGSGRRLRRKVADWPSSDDGRAGVCGLTRSSELVIPVNKDTELKKKHTTRW